MPFGVQVIGIEKLVSGLNRSPAVVAAESRAAMTAGCLMIEASARSLAPKRTGRLAGSISHRISGSGGSLVGEIGPSVQYGIYVEYGTRPHWMPPGILPFPAMRAIARRGTRPHPYMRPAFESNVGRVTKLFTDIGFKVVGRIVAGG